MGYLVIYLCEKCQYLFDLENRQGDSQDGGASAAIVKGCGVGQAALCLAAAIRYAVLVTICMGYTATAYINGSRIIKLRCSIITCLLYPFFLF